MTNRILGGKAPSIYLDRLEKSYGLESKDLDQILESHCIDPEILRSDEFELFILDRASKLLDVIENSMGKKISGRDSDEVIHEFGERLD